MKNRQLLDHPTVKAVRAREAVEVAKPVLDREELRALCLAAGADDVGFVEIERPALDAERAGILAALPGTRSLVSLVVRMNREPIRSPSRSVSNLEFHHTGDKVNDVARTIVAELERRGIRALNPSMGFPMEMDRFPGKIWVVSHKPVAVAAGLGQIGIHRNVIHPRFGNFILLGTILVAAEIRGHDAPIDYNPCLSCKLCVAACPVGAIGAEGEFDFLACNTHNYREFMSGFTDWVGEIADSSDRADYARRVSASESASMWQSLAFGPNYKAAYCLAVCPAGEDVISPFLQDRKRFVDDVVRPLVDKVEDVYVIPGSDAESHLARRFPHKRPRRVKSTVRASTIAGFLFMLPRVFKRGKAAGLDATYHFVFTGKEEREATIVIRDQRLTVSDGLQGEADLVVTADGAAWLGVVARERSVLWASLTRKIRLRGSPNLLAAFSRCFN
jgi:Fe-S-cluster-containing hydrogenase component 2